MGVGTHGLERLLNDDGKQERERERERNDHPSLSLSLSRSQIRLLLCLVTERVNGDSRAGNSDGSTREYSIDEYVRGRDFESRGV